MCIRVRYKIRVWYTTRPSFSKYWWQCERFIWIQPVNSTQPLVVEIQVTVLCDDANTDDVNGKTVDGGYTPLRLAASAGHVDCVEELLKYHKTDMHVTDAFSRTPLETAKQNFKSDVAKLLRSYGKNFVHVLII